MAVGMRNRMIADLFGISTKTLDVHRANVVRKMGTTSGGMPLSWLAATGHLSPEAKPPVSKEPVAAGASS